MNTKICPKCGKDNAAQMRFCSNCGQSLPIDAASNRQDEPPPTVFMGQPPPKPQSPPMPPPTQQPQQSQSPFGQTPPPIQQNAPNNPFNQQSTPANNPFGQQSAPNTSFGQPNPPFNQPNIPNAPQFSTPAPPAQPPKSNKGLIFGAIGCLGLLVISIIGAGVVGFVFYGSSSSRTSYDSPTPTPYSTGNSLSNTAKNTTSTSNSTTSTDAPSSNLLTTILESRKSVGSFNQTDVKAVVASEYFPEGTGAAQATYSNGSKNVFLTVGQFSSMEDTKKNFEDQIRGVKSNGGKVTYQNTASDGTISAIYEKGGYFFAEYCNTNKFCNRIHSNNRDALKSFFGSYAKD